MILVEDFFRSSNVADLFRALHPRHDHQPVEVVAGDRGLRRHGRHGFELLQFLQGFVLDFFWHARAFDLLFQFVKLALFATAQFLLDGFDLFVEVVLFLGLFHLALHARLDGTVDIELFDLDIEYIRDAGQALGRIENLKQFLFFFDGELKVRHKITSVSLAGSSIRTAEIMVS